MSLIKCNKCGEMFSDSYKTCPFCVEDEEYYNGKVKKRGHRQMEQKKKAPSAVGPVLLLVVVLLVAGLIWAFAGDTVKGWFGSEKDDAPITDQQPNKPDASTPDKPDDSQTPENTALSLDRMTLLLAPGESQKLTASGGSGEEAYRWIPGDESVAKLTDDGTVTGVAEGTTTITVICGDESVACAVTVQKKADVSTNTDGDGDGDGDSSTTTKPDNSTKPDTNTKPDSTSSGTTLKNLKIKTMYGTELGKNPDGQFDMTIGKTDPPCELTLEGVSGTAKWKSSDTSVVKVSSEGVVERVGSGTATITITVGSGTAEILVRVN